jgi:hypothetical protein
LLLAFDHDVPDRVLVTAGLATATLVVRVVEDPGLGTLVSASSSSPAPSSGIGGGLNALSTAGPGARFGSRASASSSSPRITITSWHFLQRILKVLPLTFSAAIEYLAPQPWQTIFTDVRVLAGGSPASLARAVSTTARRCSSVNDGAWAISVANASPDSRAVSWSSDTASLTSASLSIAASTSTRRASSSSPRTKAVSVSSLNFRVIVNPPGPGRNWS